MVSLYIEKHTDRKKVETRHMLYQVCICTLLEYLQFPIVLLVLNYITYPNIVLLLRYIYSKTLVTSYFADIHYNNIKHTTSTNLGHSHTKIPWLRICGFRQCIAMGMQWIF